MASTFSNLGLNLQATGENSGTWGAITNVNLQDIDAAISGVYTITVTGNTTLAFTTNSSSTTYTDEAGRNKVIILNGSLSATTITITVPNIDKDYIIVNNSGGTATISSGGSTTVSIGTGYKNYLFVDAATTSVATAFTDQVNSPGGTSTNVQYNLSGAFAGSTNFTFDGTTVSAVNVSASGTVYAANHVGTTVTVSGNITGSTVFATNLTVSGTATATNFVGTNVTVSGNITGSTVFASNVTVSGNITGSTVFASNVTVSGTITGTTANVTTANVTTANVTSLTAVNATVTNAVFSSTANFLTRSELRFQDAAGGEYIGLRSSTTVATSFTLNLPTTSGTANQVIQTDGSGNLSFATVSGGAQWQTVQSTSFTATVKYGYFIDTSTTAITATLPSSPTLGDFIQFIDYSGTFDTNNLTVARNGNKIQGVAEDLTVSVERAGLTLIYTGSSTQGWLLETK